MNIKKAISSWMTRWGYSAGILSFLAIAIYSTLNVMKIYQLSDLIVRTNQTIHSISMTLSHIERAENSYRSYFITGDQNFLKEEEKNHELVREDLSRLREFARNSNLAAKRVFRFEKVVANQLQKSKDLAKLKESKKNIDFKSYFNLNEMGLIRDLSQQMITEENQVLVIRTDRATNLAIKTIVMILTGLILVSLLMTTSHRILAFQNRQQREQTVLLESIVNSMNDGLIVSGRKSELRLLNPAAAKYIGIGVNDSFSSQSHKDYGIFDAKTMKHLTPEESPTHLALLGKSIDDFEVFLKNAEYPDGIYLNIDSYPIRDEHAQISAVVSIYSDITRRKSTELEWQSAHEAAVEASRLKSDFLATMSHEIRTPMNGVIGMATLLLDSPLTSEQKYFVNIIKSSADSLLTVINGVLDHSKIESGQLVLEETNFNLRHLVDSSLDMFKYSARSKQIDLQCIIAPSVDHSFQGDAGRIKQILINLIGNACKFTEKGFVQLKISGQEEVTGKMKLLFEVKDTGIGIPKEAIPRLFEKFSQVHQGHFKKYGGSGLGLMISKQFVQLMGGKIGIESVEGLGSKFWFTIDLPICEQAKDGQLKNEETKDLKFTGHILIAEDQRVNQLVAQKYIEKFGLTCDIVANGKDVLRLVAQGKYDLVLMDCQMPELSGYEATLHIRENEKLTLEHLPIVALTAEGMSGERKKCYQVGMDDFLSKPIDRTELQKILSKYLSLQKQEELIDLAVLKKLEAFKSNGKPLQDVLIEQYLIEAPQLIKEIQGAINNADLPSMSAAAHALKSTSRTLGLNQLGDLCHDLELLHQFDERTSTLINNVMKTYSESCKKLVELSALKSNQAA